ncbi:hypothetical protein DW083_21600, partial [Parabacteroides sp. AF48-14]|uniref:YDG domain-containing protein n=1 Tax=Parabacteroides sp. AF48-14 TaxID=2292052 RepID=UPI000FF29581
MAVTSVGWVHAQENATQSTNGKLTAEDVGTGKDLRKYVYANGNPITITAKGEKGVTIKSGEEDILEYENGAIVILFGGKKNAFVETSTITMESGTLRNLYGGGYGELSQNGGEKSADVKGSTTITIKGGTIDNILAAGGLYYAKSKDVVIEVSGNASVAYPFMGGVESGSTKKNTIETTYENSVNSVESTKFSMTGGKVTGYIGCGGGQGYSYSKKTEVTLDGVEIPTLYGIASNGRSDKVTVKAIGCKITTEFSAINRGRVGVLDMTFDGCEFGDKVEGFLGATEGWANSDTKTTEIPQVLESVSCTIVNTKKGAPIVRIGQGLDAANVNLIGAKAYNKPFKDKTTGTGGTTFNSFNIGKDKVWNFYNGLLTEDATLTLDQTKDHKAVLNNMFFADGKAIMIEARGESKEGVKIGNEEYDKTLQVYGGSYKNDVNGSTSITMTGGTVKNIFGGGYGSNKKENDNLSADVKDVSINITGGIVSNLLEGGGKYQSKADNVVISISGADTKIATLYAGGYDAGLTSNTLETPLAESVNGVQTVKLTMEGGEITEGIGCGGGQGYTRTGKSTVNLKGVKIAAFYGVLANGRADDIEATVTNCTFAKVNSYYEFASVNRGTVGNITCTFDGCTFNDLENINACLGPINGWADSDTDGKIIPCVTGKVKFEFTNTRGNAPVMQLGQGLENANIELIGAKAKLATFTKKTNDNPAITISEFGIAEGKTWTFDNDKPLSIDKDITLSGKGTINGHIVLSGENVTLDGLTVNATSFGTQYGHEKTVVFGNCDKATIKNCKLNGSAADASKYVSNGIQLTTKTSAAAYTITGNTFTGCNGLVGNDVAINILIQDVNTSNVDDAAIALKNTYDDKSFGYVRMTANDAWQYVYVNGADDYKAANAFYCMREKGGTIVASDVMSDGILNELNTNDDPFEMKGNISATCKDGYITTNQAEASKLLAEGKAVKLLKYNADATGETPKYAYADVAVAPLIMNLPDSVAFASTPIKLAFNTENVVVTTESNLVSLTEDGVLSFLNPGEVELKLVVKIDSNNDGKIDESDTELTNTQNLKITKRTLTLTAGIVPNYGAENKGDSIVYNAKDDVTLKWDADNIAVSGLPWEAATSGYFNISTTPTGKRANKNVGDKVPVEIANALLNTDSAKRYTLAPITFVTAKVVKAKATVNANDVTYTFGSEKLPTFTAKTSNLQGGDALDGTLKFICSATPDSLVKDGGYDIMPYGLTSDNYAITFGKGTLTVKATNPKIEIVDAKVTGTADAKTITVQAKLVHAGGLKDAAVTAKDEVANAASNENIKPVDGIYKYEVSSAAAGKHTITFTATTTEESNNTGTASIDVTVEAGTPQNLAFDDKVLSSIVYGDSLALIVSSDQTGATGKYTFSVASGATISANNVLKPTAAGDVVVTVSRAADDSYSSATITKTIKVTPRPLKAEVAAFTKKYDGNVTATVPAIKLSADYKVIGSDQVSIKTENISATYASKNVGTHAITLSTLVLTGNQSENYILIQPTGLKGEITKKDATVKVDDVTRMYNQRYTKYSFTATDLVTGESLSSVYTGKLDVTENEKDGTLTLKIDGGLCQNYNLKAENGKLTITKGTPVVVAYKDGETPKALVVDPAGHQNLKVSETVDVNGYFQVTSDDGSVTNSVNAITTGTKAVNALSTTKASDPDWTGWNSSDKVTKIEYAVTGNTITKVDGYEYSSTSLNRLTIDADGKLAANGVGKVAIIATNTSTGDVKVKLYEVTPKEITYAADMSKTYDGLTQATGTVTLDGVVSNDNVVLDLDGVTFNYASPAAGTKAINPSQAPILTGADANNYNLASKVTGKIDQKAIKVSAPISAYYTGSKDMILDEFTAEGILSNDIVSLSVTLDNETVGTARKFKLEGLGGDNAANYTLSNTEALEGTILKPTIIVTVPETASSTTDAKNKLTYTIRETGKPVSGAVFSDAVQVISLGNNVYQVSTKAEDPNFSLVYTSNSIGYKAAPTPPSGGGDEGDETVTISLDATTKTLPRTEEFVLKATVSPSDKTVTWSSSDPTIASVTANGNSATVKALKVGTATITAKIGDVTATCEVTVDFATGLEEALANTQVYAKQGSIYVNPIQPLQLTIV